jgi:hypothetical protein
MPKTHGCKLRYWKWGGEGTGTPSAITAASARATAGAVLFEKLRKEACRNGHAVYGRHGYYFVVAARGDLKVTPGS